MIQSGSNHKQKGSSLKKHGFLSFALGAANGEGTHLFPCLWFAPLT